MTGVAGPPELVDADEVLRAADRLRDVAHRTPVLRSRQLDEIIGAQVFCKAEHLQRVGAFKFRGAYNALAAMDPGIRKRGVVAFSSGNHAQAVALAARIHGVPATIVMPHDAPPVKADATRGYGAEVVGYDRYTEDRRAIGQAIADERGATVVPPYDHAEVIAGQGTATLELLDEVGHLDVVLVPVGGGGLAAGAALAVAARDARTRVIGVEPEQRRAARDALVAGDVVTVDVPQTVLDGQQTPEIGRRNLAVLSRHGVDVVGVTDRAALDAVRWLATRAKQVVEPSGAAALGALLDGRVPDLHGARVGVVLSGGNLTPSLLARALGTETPGLE